MVGFAVLEMIANSAAIVKNKIKFFVPMLNKLFDIFTNSQILQSKVINRKSLLLELPKARVHLSLYVDDDGDGDEVA